MKNKVYIVLLCLACSLLSCTRTDSSTTTKELTQNEIAETIHKVSHSGLRGNSETLMKYVEMINSYNVGPTVNTYMNTYNESMFGALMRNRFISSETRAKAVRHIKDMFMELSKRDGVYTDDLDKLMEGHIEYEKNKFGRMKSKDLDRDLRFLTDRYNQTIVEKNTFTFIPANGKIDSEFKQGVANDCWLIATIKSLSIHPKGRKMLDELITVNDDENVTVQLKGIDKKYSISKEELKGAKELAQGDFDVRALEIAVYRYIHEKVDHKNVIKRIRDIDNDSSIIPISNDFYNGMNFLCTSYCILFGNEWCADEKPNKETIEKIKSGNYSTIVLSNNQYNMEGFSKHHVYAVTGADDNFVFLSNPYNPNEIQKMTHDDFLSFFKQCYSTEL